MGRQIEPAAILEQWNQLVEFRTRVCSGQDDPYRVKEILSLDSGFRLDLVHQLLKTLRSHRAGFGADLRLERLRYFRSCFGIEYGRVFWRRLRDTPDNSSPFR